MCVHTSKRVGGLNSLERLYSTVKRQKVVGGIKLGKTQRMTGLLWAVLNVMCFSF